MVWTAGNAAGPEIGGVRILRNFLGPEAQRRLLAEIREVLAAAPLRRYETPGGRRLSAAMSAAGRLGWISDRRGYRYEPRQPDGRPWPAIPPLALEVWQAVAGVRRAPDCCLVNHYGEGARMGLHQDRDEGELFWPVVSISLGDPALFRIGGVERPRPTRSVWLESGDVALLAGAGRLAWHGIDRIRFGASPLLAEGGRFNLTLRVVAR